MRLLACALVLLAGCGSGGSGGVSNQDLVGNWAGTWSNAQKGTSGRVAGEYHLGSSGNAIFTGVFHDAQDTPIIDAQFNGTSGGLTVKGSGETVSSSFFVYRPSGGAPLQTTFIASGLNSYVNSQFTGTITKQ